MTITGRGFVAVNFGALRVSPMVACNSRGLSPFTDAPAGTIDLDYEVNNGVQTT